MRLRLTLIAAGCVAALAGTTLTASAGTVTAVKGITLPSLMASTGGGSQLITAVTSGPTNAARTGTLTWWQRVGTRWTRVGSAPARFGSRGLSDNRLEGDGTTPTGLYGLPVTFGVQANPRTRMPWHRVDGGSWWNENSLSSRYNTWYENCPASTCWESATRPAHSSEHLASHRPQYNYAIVIGFNTGGTKIRPPRRPSGSGIFLHVNGTGYTAGCISIPQANLVALLKWLNPSANPHIAIGNATSIYRF